MERLADLDRCLDHFSATSPRFPRLKSAVRKSRTYSESNRAFIPNYGKRYRNGETISTAFVESPGTSVLSTRLVKKQSMQWTKGGAHWLLQTRGKTLNHELGCAFRRWYPEFRVEESVLAA